MDHKLLFDKPLLLDGAMGTMLQNAGLKIGAAPDAWNIENPAAVTAVHAAYVNAGAKLLLANTFGANAVRQKHGGYTVRELVRAGIFNARAASRDAFVALDVGPLGAFLDPLGELSFEEAVAFFSEAVEAGTDADAIMIETMMDLNEALAAVTAAKKHGAGLPVICTFSMNDRGRLLTGADIPAVCAAMENAGADAIGCNCGLGPEQLLPLIGQFQASTRLPLVMKPNAGLPVMSGGKAHYDMPPARFASRLKPLAEAGVWAIGGCCGTTPEHIQALASELFV